MTMTRPTTEQITHNGQILKDVLGPIVNPLTFGAVGDGVADDTVALKAAFDYAIPLSLPVVLRGSYRVTGYIQDRVNLPYGEMHIICDGNVTITVDPASTAFDHLIACQVAGPTNMSITGGSLKIDCSLKAAEALYFYNNDTVTGGTVNLECPITILNCRLNRTTGVNLNASGISCFGLWKTVSINSPTVIQVERAGAGTCRGITVEIGDDGHCSIRNPYIKNVLHGPGAFVQSADGIGVSGYLAPGASAADYRSGTFIIDGGTFVDCQGRSLKVQASNCTVICPRIFRQAYVTQTNGTDLDFQFGNGTVISPTFEYRLNNGVSPLGASYTALYFGQSMTDAASCSVCRDMTVISDHQLPARLIAPRYLPNVQNSTMLFDGINLVPASGFAGDVGRAIVQIVNADTWVIPMAGTATVIVRNVRGPFSGPVIVVENYTTGGAIANKLAIEITGTRNTTSGTLPPAFQAFDPILTLDRFLLADNEGLSVSLATTGNVMSGFDFATLPVGSSFAIAMSYIGTVLNPPPWETSSFGGNRKAFVEVLAIGNTVIGLSKMIRVTVLGGSTNQRVKVFVSIDNASTWQEVGACLPSVRTGDFTVQPTEDVIINNKTGSACVVTLPSASTYAGRKITIKTIQAQAVTSASSNVVPLAGGAAGTAIVSGTAGKYADLVSDGTNWIIMAAN